ncbi:MAG: PepSY-like domain-containing protein, partial [Rikenellaceae bacterium]|nr:PepSY-like domain-containing protein [Rikenellaceae bacterium]
PAALVPEAIAKLMVTNYPDAKIVQLEKRGSGYEIELSDDREMLFDASGNLIKIDD